MNKIRLPILVLLLGLLIRPSLTDSRAFGQDFGFWKSTTTVPDITTGLVGWWKCNEGTGTNIADSSGNGYTGTFLGSTTPGWTTYTIGSATGNAITFNGTTAYIDCGIITQLYGQSHATMTVWVYRANNSDSVGVGQTCASFNCAYRFSVGWVSGGTVYQSVENGSVSYPNFANTTTGWHFYVLVFDGTLSGASNVRVQPYFDGVAVSQGSISSGASNPAATTAGVGNAGHWYFGRDISSASYDGGAITDCRIYTLGLTGTQITQLYNNGPRK